jgi:hydrogenase expression/formation protein HypC
MCLAVPGQIQHIEDDDLRTGIVSFAGVTKEVCLTLVPEASVGDFVIVHVGFAISKIDERSAKKSLAMIAQLDRYPAVEEGSS